LPDALCLALLLSASAASSQSYTLDWFKVAGGGGTSTNGQYAVSGSIGQPDAGSMSGSNYTLTGGFWSVVAAVQTPGTPLLTITLNPLLSTINVSWPSPSTGFALQQNTNLANPSGWSGFGGQVNDNGTIKNVTINLPARNLFYRLKK
jgi:hypothetical protein